MNKPTQLSEIRKLINEIKDVNKEFEVIASNRNEVSEMQIDFVKRLQEGLNKKNTDKIFDLNKLKKRKEILKQIELKYPNDKNIFEYLKSLEDRITHGAKMTAVLEEGIKTAEKLIKENKAKLKQIEEERNRFVDSVIKEYNESTESLRNEVKTIKKIRTEDLQMTAPIQSTKKSNNEHIQAEPSNTLSSGQSLFTTVSYLPENVNDPYWGYSTPRSSGRGRGRGSSHGRGRGRKSTKLKQN